MFYHSVFKTTIRLVVVVNDAQLIIRTGNRTGKTIFPTVCAFGALFGTGKKLRPREEILVVVFRSLPRFGCWMDG